MPEPPEDAPIVVAGDARRCELHRQCDGLSARVFAAADQLLRLRPGTGPDTRASVSRSVRSCPMNALTIVGAELSDPLEK
ncbi:hypothetical protein [Amycolatopsis sp. cmx-4-83]|uniref:hypothetical protein n=1 Tax=Amycolatopsis sp. cmx-4-83 TaxID=2790940 RepID=UPI00397BB36A